MRYILGTKVGMIQLFDVNGKTLPSTIVHAEPNRVLAVKTFGKDHKRLIQVGYKTVDAKKLNKAGNGIFKKAGSEPKRFIREFRDGENLQKGQEIKVNTFSQGEYVDVQGTTRGRGFTGAIARWNFKIGPLGHGAGYPHRYQGTVAFGRGGSQAQRVPKGKKMSGHYGHETVTISNLMITDVNLAKNLIIIQGSIPGPVGSLVTIRESIKKHGKKEEIALITKLNQEEILKQNEALEDKEALYEVNKEIEAKELAEAEQVEQAANSAKDEKK